MIDQNWRRRKWGRKLVGLGLWAFAALAGVQILSFIEPFALAQKLVRKSEPPAEKPENDLVKLLTFNDQHHLVKIKLRLLEWPPLADKPVATLESETKEALSLRRAERALWHPLARAFQKHFHTTGNAPAYGELRLTFTDGECFIGMHEGGFTLNNHHWNTDDLFYSWTLSRLADELAFQKSGTHLSAPQLAGLSGESVLQGEKEAFEKEEAKRHALLELLPK